MPNNTIRHNKRQNGTLMSQLLPEDWNLKDYIPLLLRGKWIIILITIVIFVGTVYVTTLQERIYEASVSVYINTSGGKSSILGGIVVVDPKSIGNELELLQSRMIAELVAERLMEVRYFDASDLEPIPILTHVDQDRQQAFWSSKGTVTNRVQKRVSFTSRRDSDFIIITARSNNNQEAALLANTYAQVYYDRNYYVSGQQSRAVREFLEHQLAVRRNDLEEAERKFQRYMEEQGVVMMDDETRRVIAQISQLEAQREVTDVEIKSLSNTLLSLRNQFEKEEPNVARNISSSDNPYIRMIQERIAQLEVERDLTLTRNPNARHDERYRKMIDQIDDQLETLRENLHRRTREYMQTLGPSTTADPASFIKQLRQRILENEIQLQGLEFKRAAIKESLRRYDRQFDQLPQVSMEYARLERSRMSNEKLYLMLEQHYNEALIKEQSEFGSVDIIDRALVPSEPVSLPVMMKLLLGLLFGLGVGVGFVLAREKLFGRIHVPEDIHKNGYITLTAVSRMQMKVKKVSKNGKIKINGKEMDVHLIMLSDPLSPTAESFRLLRTKLQYTQIDKKIKTLVITSPNPSEGKSTTSANLAICYAQAAERVLLIDCDLRKRGLAEILGQNKRPGLTEVLANKNSFHEAVQKTIIENLDFLSSGSRPANPAEILGSKKMQLLLAMQSDNYDIILLDTPPILAASDPLVLATIVDDILLVVASGRTRMRELDLSRESIEEVGLHYAGVVLNFFDHRQAYGSLYKYKYYRYGNYGYSDNHKNGEMLETVKLH